MWKQITKPAELSDYEINRHGIVRNILTKDIVPQYMERGYPIIKPIGHRTPKGHYKYKHYKVHRLVAQTFIGDIPKGYVVHHIDMNKKNPYYKNLLICSRTEHMRIHTEYNDGFIKLLRRVPSTPAKHGDVTLDEKRVHEICKLLEKGVPYPKIRDKLGLYNITDDCIGKIAQGKNWHSISSQYNIKPAKRSTMNSFSNDAFKIALMREAGMTYKEIGKVLHIDVDDKTTRNRLQKAARRYVQQFQSGKWGSISTEEINSYLKDIIH